MAKRRGTKLQRHLAHLRDTGQLTSWLQKRMEWDEATVNRILADMWKDDPLIFTSYIKMGVNLLVSNPRSSVRITGLSVP